MIFSVIFTIISSMIKMVTAVVLPIVSFIAWLLIKVIWALGAFIIDTLANCIVSLIEATMGLFRGKNTPSQDPALITPVVSKKETVEPQEF